MAILYCNFCKKETPRVTFDGYSIGDRTLEDVPVGVKLAPTASDKTANDLEPEDIIIDWEDAYGGNYVQQLNLDHFAQKAQKHVATHGECFKCSECNKPDYAGLYDDEQSARNFFDS